MTDSALLSPFLIPFVPSSLPPPSPNSVNCRIKLSLLPSWRHWADSLASPPPRRPGAPVLPCVSGRPWGDL